MRSKRILEDQVGGEVTDLRLSLWRGDAAVRALVARHYRAACSADLGTARRGGDRFWLPRIDAFYLRRPEVLRLLETTPGRAYLAARAAGRRLRRALARGMG